MSVGILGVMLYVSLFLGFIGLVAFLWGIKNHQFSDEKKMLQGVLYDGEEELNLAKQKEENSRRKNV
ncbi:cytochrome oxidase maturation protein, cbb3-type [Helicobacter enhydrae]|uniref:Cytochrome oxidase maturation protein, cbb3-type n=1 Tax=Helicobacter enhydrae TaxID=222136 RepID=A0A1B1U4Z6_9HELI|nr:cbb3-type cytochrome oxidase assembly protein CcoS [Helicobacter enhydrae]ANV97782.1 cytochrome oxidase maturation protein, cbb3-type [Helicobacter enhydrae]